MPLPLDELKQKLQTGRLTNEWVLGTVRDWVSRKYKSGVEKVWAGLAARAPR